MSKLMVGAGGYTWPKCSLNASNWDSSGNRGTKYLPLADMAGGTGARDRLLISARMGKWSEGKGTPIQIVSYTEESCFVVRI